MGEGAGIVMLEELEHARARGATIYAEVLGYGASNDAYHMAAPDPDSVGVAEMMRAALDRSGVDPVRVDYINAHGTSTPLGDAAETKAIKDVFGDHAYDLAVSSTKSTMGHLLGAAGAVEAIMSRARDPRRACIPPTINYHQPDPTCDLDYVPNEAREAEIDVALSNAMGLGGHNGCVLLGRVVVAAGTGPASTRRRTGRMQIRRPTDRAARSRSAELGQRRQDDVRGGERLGPRREAARSGRRSTRMPAARADRMPLCESSTAAAPRRVDAEAPRSLEVDVRARACRGRPPRTTPSPRNRPAIPASSSARSMSERFDEHARPSGQRAASRSTASTAPGTSGSRSR